MAPARTPLEMTFLLMGMLATESQRALTDMPLNKRYAPEQNGLSQNWTSLSRLLSDLLLVSKFLLMGVQHCYSLRDLASKGSLIF